MKGIKRILPCISKGFIMILIMVSLVSLPPVQNMPLELKKYNGDIIKYYVTGDEYFHFL